MILTKSNLLLIFIPLLFSFANLQSTEVLRFGNVLFQKSFSAQKDQPDGIYIDIYNENNKLLNNADFAYFQLHVNNHLLKSTDKIWQFERVTERLMGNAGVEFEVNFLITTGPCLGLKLTIIQQYFPESALVREKLILSTETDNVFKLTRHNSKNHFQFPNYQISSKKAATSSTTEIKLASWELKPTTFGPMEKGNHMYYPNMIQTPLTHEKNTLKGPIVITTDGEISWFTAYEHASQDNTNGMFKASKKESKFIVDAMQGTKGVFNFAINDEDFMFLGINTYRSDSTFNIGVAGLCGAYYTNEKIDLNHPYASVWTATSFYEGADLAKGKEILRKYILEQICEKPISREIEFYYNTWGMQRNDESKALRGILTYDRIFEEIDYASKLGIDIFVLDDGWEQAHGDRYNFNESFNYSCQLSICPSLK